LSPDNLSQSAAGKLYLIRGFLQANRPTDKVGAVQQSIVAGSRREGDQVERIRARAL